MKKRFLEAGKIVNTHGVGGEVKILPWADSAEFLKNIPVFYIDGRPVKPLGAHVHKNFLITRLEGFLDVNAAMALKNRVVYIDRSDAVLPEGAFFIQDIIGARVVNEDGGEVGTLKDVIEAPASNIYVVSARDSEILIPAVPAFILNTDVENGLIRVRLIEGM